MSTNHMLSQLTKTIKLALKSTEEERAILRARSAIQRFPVVEWRQKTEDFHKRSINISRSHAGALAFTAADCDGSGARPIGMDTSDWTPEMKGDVQQPDWDNRSIRSNASGNKSPMLSQENLASNNINGHLGVPGLLRPGMNSSRNSVATDMSEDDYASDHSRTLNTPGTPAAANYGDFLSRVNKVVAKDQRHVGDPFLDANPAPNRPFGAHHRVSSVESISSIVEEHNASPLNKAIASVRYPAFVPFIIPVLIVAFHSSPMRMVTSRSPSSRNCSSSVRTTLRANCRSNDTWSRARKPSSKKSRRTR